MIWNFLKNLFQSPQQPLSLFGRTDTGRTRPNNEDSFVILPQSRIMMVADGMGGHNAGEVASRAAIESMVHLVDTTNALHKAGSNQEEILHLLIHALRKANDQVMLMACGNPSFSGMGCTFIIAFVNRGRLFTCHVGDVRAYLLSDQGLRQLTTDHTYLAEFSRHSETGQETTGPRVKMTRHVVSRAIGFPFPEDPECTTNPITAGNRILLCSDGLWSMLPDPELATILREARTPEDACDRLIAQANQAGGKDNITAVVSFI